MAGFTKALREKIVRDFCARRNSGFDAKLFEQEVRETGPSHPAYEWFEWDDDKAAAEYRVWQAREFVKDLRVVFTVEEIGRSKAIQVKEVSAPMLVSPLDGRGRGGGYFLTDPEDPAHMAELCRQAATDLDRWLRRYEAAVWHSGGALAAIERQLRLLEKASTEQVDEAA